MFIIGHRPTHCIDFDEFRIDRFFTELQRKKKDYYVLQPLESNHKKYASV